MNQPTFPNACGVLLAAGRGRRMGGGKQLLPWPDASSTRSLIATSYDALHPHVSQMLLALGHRSDEVHAALAPRQYQHVDVNPDAEMFESIRAALRVLASAIHIDVAIVHPADQPCIDDRTMLLLQNMHAEFPTNAVMPEYHGQGGHPVVIPRVLWPRIIENHSDGGLRQFWRDYPSLAIRFPVSDPTSIADIDVPSDYDSKV